MKTKRFDNVKYNIGLDIGTNSVGWAVTDENARLLKYKSKNMWGSRLFEAGESAKDTRVKRNTRRRYARRRQRILWLQELLTDDMKKVDSSFFDRLKESFLWQEDRKEKNRYTLFNGSDLTEKEYYESYPTIYHLRKALCNSKGRFDFRLVYLAMHHIIKYRGNFLYQGQNLTGNVDIKDTLTELFGKWQFTDEIEDNLKKELVSSIEKIIVDNSKYRKDKKDEISKIIEVYINEEKKESGKLASKALSAAILNYEADYRRIFELDLEEPLKITVSDEADFEKAEANFDDEQMEIFEFICKIHSGLTLRDILKDNNTISQAMVRKYETFSEDFKELKRLIKKYGGEKGKKILAKEGLYENYLHGKKDALDTLKKEIKTVLGTNVPARFEAEDYLPRINSKENGAIPYQLHKNELEMIIDNQAKYYPSLTQNKDKIISILEFKIPYYVGPITTANGPLNLKGEPRFHWIERKGGKIYPWNFKEMIYEKKTAEKFITRMLGNCSYLIKEPSLPRYSLLYSEFAVRNEIKQISIAGKKLSLDYQKLLFDEVFCNKKKVTEKTLRKWCLEKGILSKANEDAEINGFSKENEFANTMQSYIDLKEILGDLTLRNYDKAEKIIRYITIFEDKKILEKTLREDFSELKDDQIKNLLTKRYNGWGNLSAQLLNGITSKDHEKTILELLCETRDNFMQIINNDKYGFQDKIREENNKNLPGCNISYAQVDELVCSPAVKKGIWQAISVVKELVDIIGHEPENIFLEFAREEGVKKRTVQRYKQLSDLYKKIKDDTDFKDAFNELLKYEENKKALDSRRLFLYFTQNGRCLYTGTPLDIKNLETYQIDHILPQAYIKDDSFTNLALVKSIENQRKSDSLLLNERIINKQKHFWTKLLESGLITKSKYNRLTRTRIDEDELSGFINRQLVETRQIILNVANLLKFNYPDTEVHSIKASLTHNLREKYFLPKVREINDYHHAHDAFLTSFIGIYLEKRFPGRNNPFLAKKIGDYLKEKEALSSKYGFFIDSISMDYINKTTGELIWNAKENTEYIIKALNYHDCFSTKKLEDHFGKFWEETILKRGNGIGHGSINLKKFLSIEKYGGFDAPRIAFFVLARYERSSKKCLGLIGIPTYVFKQIYDKNISKDVIIDYLKSKGYLNCELIVNKNGEPLIVHIKQKIGVNGTDYYIYGQQQNGQTHLYPSKQFYLNLDDIRLFYQYHKDKLILSPSEINKIQEDILNIQNSKKRYAPILTNSSKNAQELIIYNESLTGLFFSKIKIDL